MSTYAIGDIQGCHEAFRRLLDAVRFDPAQDRLWLVGDLVNRGPDSLAVLRLVRDLGEAAVTVLGNHDLHLLVVAEGFGRLHRKDTIGQVLEAPDRDELLAWLRDRPLLHREGEFLLVHAGLLPGWSADKAKALAGEVQAALRGPGYRGLLEHMYGNQPDRWDDALAGWDRLRVVVNAMTRMRLCTPEGVMEFGHKGEVHLRPSGFVPWFEAPAPAWQGSTVVCGHWSALGLELREGLMALDSGCLWGGHLTAVRVEDRRVYQVSCAGLAGTARWQ